MREKLTKGREGRREEVCERENEEAKWEVDKPFCLCYIKELKQRFALKWFRLRNIVSNGARALSMWYCEMLAL